MPEIFKPKYIPKEPRPAESTESKQVASPEINTPEGSFAIGQEVTVGRNSRDAEGNVIKGQLTPEAGWKVKRVDDEAGTVDVLSPDGVYVKTYSVDRLRTFNPLPTEKVAAIEHSVDTHTEALEHRGERHLSAEEFEEIGEPAVEMVVGAPAAEAPNPWSKEAADQRRRAEGPRRETPRMFDTENGLVRLYEFPVGNGRMAEGVAAGVFTDDGRNITLIEPSAAYRRETGFQGKYVEVPAELLHKKQAKQQDVENPYAQVARTIITANDVPKPIEAAPASTDRAYDDWLNGDFEGSVEDAAVRPVESDADRLARERRSADANHAANAAYKRPEMNP